MSRLPNAIRILKKSMQTLNWTKFRHYTSQGGRGIPTSSEMEPFLSSASSSYIEEMFQSWTKNPDSVHKSWDVYFRRVQFSNPENDSSVSGLYNYISPFQAMSKVEQALAEAAALHCTSMPSIEQQYMIDTLSVQLMIHSFQTRGHHIAQIDPLGISSGHLDDKSMPPELTLSAYKLSERDLDRQFILPRSTYIGGYETTLSLREIMNRLKNVYCGHLGIEYMHIANFDRQIWLRERLEFPSARDLSNEEKVLLLERLIKSSKFENFLSRKWPSEKRFGLEGCEVMIPAIKQIIDNSTMYGVERFNIGMAHRGRLNVLANIAQQPFSTIFDQFETLASEELGSGDVKYHLGVQVKRVNSQSHHEFELSMLANPSHLEVVGPVALGKTKAQQFFSNDPRGDNSMAILIHGDAAFSGQGVVYETFDLSQLPNYTCHGAIHIVVNNQVGFTTDPRFSRSSPYCTDVGRVLNCPIFHVNADDPEAVIHVCKVASDWRRTFKRDVIIDLVGYRRFGHSEVDEPMFTQPLMYSKIRKMKPVLESYAEKLIGEGVISQDAYKEKVDEYNKTLEDYYTRSKKDKVMRFMDWVDNTWEDFYKPENQSRPLSVPDTGVEEAILSKVCHAVCTYPPNFNIHAGLAKFLRLRGQMVQKRHADWALGEAMAFGSLLLSRVHVRLSGQDSERGAFSHRHYVLHDQKVDKEVYVAMNNIATDQAHYSINNSPLNEYGVLSFEYGYSLANPNALIIWEAQFGDFSNVAQCMIDQFISSGEAKWFRQSGLVLMLPHGYEGMGPEHSTARLERFLQMCNEDPRKLLLSLDDTNFEMEQLKQCNWFVANCTTPANYFHILRRQVLLPFRKPLVLMTPKSLLRHPAARSDFDDFLPGRKFQRLITENHSNSNNADKVQKLIFCSGKVYYELAKERDASSDLKDEVVINRIEQISPFPFDLVSKELKKYPQAKLIWAQEEPMNMGAWTYVEPRFRTISDQKHEIGYAGRPVSAATAPGNKFLYLKEQCKVVADALDIPMEKLKTIKIE